jgi:hypothetical protein
LLLLLLLCVPQAVVMIGETAQEKVKSM